MIARLRSGVAFIACVGAVACVPPRAQSKVAADVKVIQDEHAPDKLFERGKGFHAVGDLTRAEQYYAAAIKQGAKEEIVLPLLLRACIEGSRFQVAIDYAEPALKRKPDNYRLRNLIASLYWQIGQHSKARQHYEAVVKDHPDDETAHYGLGVLLRDEFHDPVGCDYHFREYLRITPNGKHADEAKASLLKSVP